MTPEIDYTLENLADYAVVALTQTGPYLGTPATFSFFTQTVRSDHCIDLHRSFQEIYLNDPMENPPEDGLTDFCIPLMAKS